MKTEENHNDEIEVLTKVDNLGGPDTYISMYARIVTRETQWMNRKQELANALLRKHKRLRLNEVYELLDLSKTGFGEHVGWIYDPENNLNGDNFVDFDIYNERNRGFINGYGDVVVLDFNVDGGLQTVKSEIQEEKIKKLMREMLGL